MYLTGKQVETLAELSDGAEVGIYRENEAIWFQRMEDGLCGTINTDGSFIAKTEIQREDPFIDEDEYQEMRKRLDARFPNPKTDFCTSRNCDQPATTFIEIREDDGQDVRYARCEAHAHSVKA